jgi:hypothetical protein
MINMLIETKFDRNRHLFRSPTIIQVVDEAVGFLLTSPLQALPPAAKFDGPGVYALYYYGDFALYAKLAALNREDCVRPIYVGKAVLPGWRQARNTTIKASSLQQRLREHARNIAATKNLKVMDFVCRFMIMEGQESNLISTVESELIRRYTPLWNSVVDGFGNHDPGRGRYNQSPSEWDVIHPGRAWAKKLTGRRPALKTITAKIQRATEAW